MKISRIVVFCLLVIAGIKFTVAQEEQNIKVIQITDKIYKISAISGYEVNLVASVGEDGILLVDTGFKNTAKELKKAIEELSKGQIKYIINTHHHTDHIGGNAVLGENATIISYSEIRKRLIAPRYHFDGYSDQKYLADVTFDEDATLHFNGEEIKMIPFPGSHTSNDAIVIFTKSKVAYLGDLAYGNTFPSWSGLQGNTIKYPKIVKDIIEILPKDVTVISGHGKDCSYTDMVEYQQVLEETVGIVRRELASGKDVETIVKEKPLSKWESYTKLYVSAENWIRSIDYFTKNPTPKQNPLNPLYETYLRYGIDAAVQKYAELKADTKVQYSFNSFYINLFANYLTAKGRKEEGLKLLDLAFREFPEQVSVYVAKGEFHILEGDFDKAEKIIKQVPEINSGNKRRLENSLNRLGYKMLNDFEKPEAALWVFELATSLMPDAFNLWDSKGEVFFEMKDYTNSRKCYNKALELNPSNKNVKKMLNKIKLAIEKP